MRNKVLVFILLSMILSACSGGMADPVDVRIDPDGLVASGDTSQTEQQFQNQPVTESEDDSLTIVETEETTYILPDPNPLDLSIVLDAGQTVAAKIGPQGGTLELETSDGNTFVLEIPSGALLSPEMIQMTAIASIDGLPFEDQGAIAVNLQPEGLVFFEMATLRIINRSINGDGYLVKFSTESNGADFYLQPSVEVSNEVRLLIFHFSNYGIAEATGAVLEHIKDRYSPSRASRYAKNEISMIREGESDQASQLEAYEKAMKVWLYGSIFPQIENSDIFLDGPDFVLGEFVEWIGVIDVVDLLWGFDGQLRERLAADIEVAMNALAERVAQLMEEAYDLCVIEKEPEEALRMYRWGLAATALNLWGRSGLVEETFEGKFYHCFAFEFEFFSVVDARGDKFHHKFIVDSRIPLIIDSFNFWDVTLSHQPVITLEWEINPSIPECQLSSVNGQLDVEIIFALNYNIYDAWRIAGVDAVLKLIEHPTEVSTCTYRNGSRVFETELWAIAFRLANQQLFDGEEMHINLSIDRYLDHYAVFFTENEIFNGTTSEFSRFSLFHKP